MAYKALNCLINGKVSSRRVELPISKPDILSKLINLVKYSFGYFIRVRL